MTSTQTHPGTDPITLEIIQNSLQAISDEMFAAFRKTAMSAIIYEVLDMGTAITDAQGNLASSGAGIPAFVGVLDKAVKRIIELNGSVGIQPGDVFVTNDPYYGGVTHLNDVVLAMPVFAGEELVAWTTNIAHWNDIGGMVPGSISNEASELFQEGLRLPAVKLIAGGAPIQPVLEIMKVNSRLPDYLQGDMWAGIASVRVGERRILELVDKYGVDTFTTALETFMTYGEEVARRALQELPQGRFSLEEEQDSGALYKVAVEITESEFIVDLSDNPDQDPGPNNASRDGTMVAAQMIFMNITGAHASANAGHFRPLTLLTRPGSVFDPRPPAAFGTYYEVEVRIYDLIWRCLAPHFEQCRRGASRRSAALSSAARTPTPGGISRSSSPKSAAGAARRGATATARFSAASTATPSTAPPRWPKHATVCTSSSSGSMRSREGTVSTAAAKGSCSTTACARTAASSPAPTRATSTSRGPSKVGVKAPPIMLRSFGPTVASRSTRSSLPSR